MENRKAAILEALRKFARQRPGLEYGNYGDWKSYSAEMRSIGKDLRHATELLRKIEWRDSIDADALIRSARAAYSGRLSIVELDNGGFRIDYCTGQYWPTEYRRAVCAVLACALWDYWRENGDKPRESAKRELSRGVAKRWFR